MKEQKKKYPEFGWNYSPDQKDKQDRLSEKSDSNKDSSKIQKKKEPLTFNKSAGYRNQGSGSSLKQYIQEKSTEFQKLKNVYECRLNEDKGNDFFSLSLSISGKILLAIVVMKIIEILVRMS